MNGTLSIFAPNRVLSKSAVRILIAGQSAMFLLWWWLATPAIIPKPTEVFGSLGDLWQDGLGANLYVSLVLYGEALLLATVYSMALCYLSAMPAFRPVATGWGKLRFMGMTGLPFLLTLYVSGAHNLKLALLAFSISVFLVTGMLDVLDSIPKEKYDLARTLRMNEWQVIWEVQVLGRIDLMFDVVRQNAAIGWMMLGMVEALWKSEGGIGAVMDIQNRHFHLASVFGIQFAILGCGLLQDYLIGVAKGIACPYAKLLLERR